MFFFLFQCAFDVRPQTVRERGAWVSGSRWGTQHLAKTCCRHGHRTLMYSTVLYVRFLAPSSCLVLEAVEVGPRSLSHCHGEWTDGCEVVQPQQQQQQQQRQPSPPLLSSPPTAAPIGPHHFLLACLLSLPPWTWQERTGTCHGEPSLVICTLINGLSSGSVRGVCGRTTSFFAHREVVQFQLYYTILYIF